MDGALVVYCQFRPFPALSTIDQPAGKPPEKSSYKMVSFIALEDNWIESPEQIEVFDITEVTTGFESIESIVSVIS